MLPCSPERSSAGVHQMSLLWVKTRALKQLMKAARAASRQAKCPGVPLRFVALSFHNFCVSLRLHSVTCVFCCVCIPLYVCVLLHLHSVIRLCFFSLAFRCVFVPLCSSLWRLWFACHELWFRLVLLSFYFVCVHRTSCVRSSSVLRVVIVLFRAFIVCFPLVLQVSVLR